MPKFTMPVPPEVLSGLDDAFKSDLSVIPQLSVSVDISGIDEIVKNAHRLTDEMKADARDEVQLLANELFARSQDQVPYRSGNLHDAGFIHEDDSDELSGYDVGYDAISVQYAWYVHEIPATHYTKPGTKDHFLTDPATELAAEFPDAMKQRLQQTLSTSTAVIRGPRLVKKAK